MPNWCSFTMRITGDPKGITRVYNAATTHYDEDEPNCPEHLWRVFDFEEHNETTYSKFLVSKDFNGNCAWSVYSCMFSGQYSYQEEYPNGHGITLTQLSREENLIIEVFSWEEGCAFSEHYLIVNGDVIIDDTVDYYLLPCDLTVKELNKYSKKRWKRADWDKYFQENEYYIVGGHNEEFCDHLKLLGGK